jgi:hypothetical protein
MPAKRRRKFKVYPKLIPETELELKEGRRVEGDPNGDFEVDMNAWRCYKTPKASPLVVSLLPALH